MNNQIKTLQENLAKDLVSLEDNVLKIAIEQGVIENEFNWKLVREHDGLTCQSKESDKLI